MVSNLDPATLPRRTPTFIPTPPAPSSHWRTVRDTTKPPDDGPRGGPSTPVARPTPTMVRRARACPSNATIEDEGIDSAT